MDNGSRGAKMIIRKKINGEEDSLMERGFDENEEKIIDIKEYIKGALERGEIEDKAEKENIRNHILFFKEGIDNGYMDGLINGGDDFEYIY